MDSFRCVVVALSGCTAVDACALVPYTAATKRRFCTLCGSMILIADDDPTTLTLARSAIARSTTPLPVLTATDGRQAALLVRSHAEALRLVLLDVQLPLLDGICVAAEIRRQTRAVPIIPITGTTAALPLLAHFSCQPAQLKPVSATVLAAAVQAALTTPLPIPAPNLDAPTLALLHRQIDSALQERVRLTDVQLDQLERKMQALAREAHTPSLQRYIRQIRDLLARAAL